MLPRYWQRVMRVYIINLYALHYRAPSLPLLPINCDFVTPSWKEIFNIKVPNPNSHVMPHPISRWGLNLGRFWKQLSAFIFNGFYEYLFIIDGFVNPATPGWHKRAAWWNDATLMDFPRPVRIGCFFLATMRIYNGAWQVMLIDICCDIYGGRGNSLAKWNMTEIKNTKQFISQASYLTSVLEALMCIVGIICMKC